MGGRCMPVVVAAAVVILAGPRTATADAAQAGSPFLAVRETWAGTMLASRELFRAADEGPQVELGPWLATEPLPAAGFADTRFPDGVADLAALDDAGEPLWTERPDWVDGAVHRLPNIDRASSYLARTIRATAPVSLTASFGSDDGLEVWLNGTCVLSRDVPRAVAPDQDRAPLDLREGENRLLIKVYNISGGHGFYFRLTSDPVALLWAQIADRFPVECERMAGDLGQGLHLEWFRSAADDRISGRLVTSVIQQTGIGPGDLQEAFERLRAAAAPDDDPRWLELYESLCRIRVAQARLDAFDLPALKRAVEDLARALPERDAREYATQLAFYEQAVPVAERLLRSGDRARALAAERQVDRLEAFRRRALLANPLLDFDRILLIKRPAGSPGLGLPQNWQGNCSLPRRGYDDALCVLSLKGGPETIETIFRPDPPRMIADVDLHWDGDRILFSMLGSHDRWQVFELTLDDLVLRQVTPGAYEDVDNYDACYLPDGRILFDSTRCFQGIPCVGGADQVANLYLLDESDGSIRRLCFDQDHNWCPAVLNDGRVLFTRWEYSDTPHYFTRLLMHMNPDGTGQMEFYGSNSYWPNSIFYARPIPTHPTRVVAVVSGHHGVPRMGELVILDPALGRFEADGVVQRIPGYGKKVEPVIADQLVDRSWPRFLHPFPLSDRHFIVSCQPAPGRPWGIYLVDAFDNMLLLAEVPGSALLEPVPLRKTARPPVIPDTVRPDEPDATIFLADVYRGPGLAGIPRGTVKRLRLYSFHYGYNNIGGHANVGIEGPWDVHRVLGTVPVYEDGSANFTVPANTPIAVQPLDAEGKALQLMRSWFTAMPGEHLSCVGCHDPQNTAAPVRATLAARRAPVAIEPWRGPARGFSFTREVQPVLDRHCVACHGAAGPDQVPPDLSRTPHNGWGNFTPSYLALHPYVRRPGPESDYHLLTPMEFHADTSELIQMLVKGHHGVELDDEDWDRLVTWIDLNVPDHGTWSEHCAIPNDGAARRALMEARYSGVKIDPEEIPPPAVPVVAIVPPPVARVPEPPAEIEGWPFGADEAVRRRQAVGRPEVLSLDLGGDVTLQLRLIPPGAFVMGSADGFDDEAPRAVVRIEEPFYLATFETTCAQYARFDPAHFNGYHDQRHKDHTRPGYLAHGPDRPVIRISWQEAMAFCAWLSRKTGRTCTLPTEAQWEWACRAGTDTPFFYGDLDTDFAPYANLADASTSRLAVTGVDPKPIANPDQYHDYLPKDARFDDGRRVMADVGLYAPNPWGLYDVHGNVCEWTRSDYRPYPYRADDGRNGGSGSAAKVVRGGSWRDRPTLARSAWRQGYRPYQPVYDVGFRVVVQP
jgi:formylglycine-generating enzyme required for sulfatase activity